MTRIAFGCDSVPQLISRMAARAEGGRIALTTRRRPRRWEEIAGRGSLFWIVKHQLVARADVLGFEEAGEGRWNIMLDAAPRLVLPTPRRAHQGWRYLEHAEAPPDLAPAVEGAAALPPALTGKLAELGLL